MSAPLHSPRTALVNTLLVKLPKTLLATVITSIITSSLGGCNWDDKYSSLNCTASPDANQTDCRSIEDQIDIVDTIDLPRDANNLMPLDSAGSVSWRAHHDDEQDLFVTADQDVLLVGSKFHNRLRVLQTDNAGHATLTSTGQYVSVSGDRYTVDAVTGASEQVISAMIAVPGSEEIQFLTQIEKYDNQSGSTGVGLYMDQVLDLANAPDLDFAYGDDSNFIDYGSIRAAAVNNDGSLLALSGSDRTLRVLDLAINSTPFASELASLTMNISGRSLAFSADSSQLFVGGITIIGQLLGFSLDSDGTPTEQWRVSTADTPTRLLSVAGNSLVAMLASGTELLWLSSDGSAVTSIQLADQATDIATNTAGTHIAVSYVSGGVELIDLASGDRAYHQGSGTGSADDIAIDQYNTLWVLDAGLVRGYLPQAGFGDD